MNFKEIAAYSLGLFGFQAIVGLLNSYQAEFDASILGADIAVVGILVLVAKILSAVFDPFVGNMIDRSKSKNGKFIGMALELPEAIGSQGTALLRVAVTATLSSVPDSILSDKEAAAEIIVSDGEKMSKIAEIFKLTRK